MVVTSLGLVCAAGLLGGFANDTKVGSLMKNFLGMDGSGQNIGNETFGTEIIEVEDANEGEETEAHQFTSVEVSNNGSRIVLETHTSRTNSSSRWPGRGREGLSGGWSLQGKFWCAKSKKPKNSRLTNALRLVWIQECDCH